MSFNIEPPKASEIECRIARSSTNSCQLLLYKDARYDMRRLDETFTPYGWKDDYKEIKGNLFCTVSIWDKEKKEWISKTDCGIESRTDGSGNQKKGEASDAFKRACTKLGIGRELYTAPNIKVYEPSEKYDEYEVTKLSIVDNKITDLEIKRIRNRKEKVVFKFKNGKTEFIKSTEQSKTMEQPNKQQTKQSAAPKNNFALISEFKKVCENQGKNFIDEAGAMGIEDINQASQEELKEMIAKTRG